MTDRTPTLQLLEAGQLRYLLSVPAAPPSEVDVLPVLCFLHGYDEAAPLPIEQGVTRHGPLRPGGDWRVLDQFIVVAPQLPTAGDIWLRYADSVREIVTQVQSRHRGDARHTYLTGFSFGGNGVFDLALAQPDFWAALWPVDPTRVPREDPKRPIWLSIGAAARPRTEGFVRALDLEIASLGARSDRLYLDEGRDHVGSATLAYRDDRIYDWLLLKHLSA